MKPIFPLAAAALVVALGACGEAGDTDRQTAGQQLADAYPPSSDVAVSSPSPQAFVDCVAAADAYEIAAAKLARREGADEAVRDFADRMVQDHTVALQELRDAVARTDGLAMAPQPTEDQLHELAELSETSGAFDKIYARQQVAAHEDVLAQLRDYAENGDDPALSEFAADAEAMVSDHLAAARKLP
jgi:putative membrane protein